MSKIRRPVFMAFILLVIFSVIYFVTSPSDDQFGSSSPITLQKYKVQDQSNAKLSPNEAAQEQALSQKINESLLEDPPLPEESKQPRLAVNFKNSPFMPQMTNETLKAQLGNAAWKLFHTILARYPDKPSSIEQTTLSQYIQLFAQVYPCGDCARHFQKILQKYPPQTRSRTTAAMWGCMVHNKVNDRLGKEDYDCTTILEDYDCGCGDDEKKQDSTLGGETQEHLRATKVDQIEPPQGG